MPRNFYDLDADERERLQEAEDRYMANRTIEELTRIREAVEASNALMMGLLVRS